MLLPIDVSADATCNCKTLLTKLKGFKPLSSHYKFLFLNHPNLIPTSWKGSTDEETVVLFMGTTWQIDHYKGFEYLVFRDGMYDCCSVVSENDHLTSKKNPDLSRFGTATIIIPVVSE